MRPTLKNLMVSTAAALLAAGCSATGTSSTGARTPPAASTTPPTAATGTGTATAPPTTTTTTTTTTATIYDCTDHPVTRPTAYTLTCGDGGVVLDHLTWAGWGTPTATATGVQLQNSCVPSCAAGAPVSTPATATLTGLTAGHYTKLHVVTAKTTTDYAITPAGPAAAVAQ